MRGSCESLLIFYSQQSQTLRRDRMRLKDVSGDGPGPFKYEAWYTGMYGVWEPYGEDIYPTGRVACLYDNS